MEEQDDVLQQLNKHRTAGGATVRHTKQETEWTSKEETVTSK